MSKFYEGEKPCPGCGRTGAEVPRASKDGLCKDCKNQLEIGMAIAKERELARNYYMMDDLRMGEITWYSVRIREVEDALEDLLSTFSQFDSRHVEIKGGFLESQLVGRVDAVTAQNRFILPDVTFDAAKKLCGVIKELTEQLIEDRDSYKRELDAQLREQKNDIYNDGVQYGRNLLFQLNRGEITADEINKRINKY